MPLTYAIDTQYPVNFVVGDVIAFTVRCSGGTPSPQDIITIRLNGTILSTLSMLTNGSPASYVYTFDTVGNLDFEFGNSSTPQGLSENNKVINEPEVVVTVFSSGPSPTYRVTKEQVEALLEFDSSIENFGPFIAAAEELVTELCAPVGYSAARLVIIESYLAAHFVAIRDPRYQTQTIGPSTDSYANLPLAEGLALTSYGQQAMVMDTNGGLALMNAKLVSGKRPRVAIMSLATNQRRYWGRNWLYQSLP